MCSQIFLHIHPSESPKPKLKIFTTVRQTKSKLGGEVEKNNIEPNVQKEMINKTLALHSGLAAARRSGLRYCTTAPFCPCPMRTSCKTSASKSKESTDAGARPNSARLASPPSGPVSTFWPEGVVRRKGTKFKTKLPRTQSITAETLS